MLLLAILVMFMLALTIMMSMRMLSTCTRPAFINMARPGQIMFRNALAKNAPSNGIAIDASQIAGIFTYTPQAASISTCKERNLSFGLLTDSVNVCKWCGKWKGSDACNEIMDFITCENGLNVKFVGDFVDDGKDERK